MAGSAQGDRTGDRLTTGRLTGEDFDRLFSTYVHTAFRLETRDHYAVSDEAESFRRFLAGKPYDLTWHQSWLAGIRSIEVFGV